MKRNVIRICAVICALCMLMSGINAFAAGYDVLSETNISYKYGGEESYFDEVYSEYWQTRKYSTLISNYSNGFSVVYENCTEQTNDFVYYTTVESSYVIDKNGNKVDIGDYDMVGADARDEEYKLGEPMQAVLTGRTTHFETQFATGVDMWGGVIVFKDGKCGYVGLKDGVKIPCEHDGLLLRYDENVFGVNPDSYLGKAEYYINVKGEKLLSEIDLSPVKNGTGTFTPSLKYLGGNMFAYLYALDVTTYTPSFKYLDINGKEVAGYKPTIDESRIFYEFDDEAFKNWYSYDYLEIGGQHYEGNKGIFIAKDGNGKYGLLDKNGNLIVPYEYDDISGLQDGYCWAAKNGKWCLIEFSDESDDTIKVTINGKAVKFDQVPIAVDGRTLTPLRAIFEELGATVEWDNKTKTVTSKKGNTVIKMTIGQNDMYKNGEKITLDVPPQIIGTRTLVPVRAIAESFDCNVGWDGTTKTVLITE